MNTLPAYLTPLIGREREEVTLGQLLGHAQVHLLTLTGPGGVGKTRLAVQAAQDCREQFADGILFIPLEGVDDPGLVLAAIARSVGLEEKGSRGRSRAGGAPGQMPPSKIDGNEPGSAGGARRTRVRGAFTWFA